jgi:type I restriction enzyme M protein
MVIKKLNERDTENIIRQHFQNDKLFSNITLEEQSSKNPRITKLLKNASKQGYGIGKPEFIISLHKERKLLIIVECKADILKHESKDREEFANYAVDGVLLYSSYLSKEYDVLSLAISGVKKDNIRVSYFIQRVGKESAEQIFGNKLITIEDIIAGLWQDVVKREEKYQELLEYSQVLNIDLHKLKIKEDKRSLLVSGILIALKHHDFYRSYSGLSSNSMLANALVSTIKEQLENENLQGEKINILMENYSFIKSHPSLIHKNKHNELKGLKILIDEIDNKINGYSRTYKYYDVLGQFYIEFLRYSNADKGLGIVLTPPHITEFFADIIDIKSDDIVLDNCTGTSGFLVSSMKKMVEKCRGDLNKEKNIKKNQLYGIEYQPEIYPLAVTNMLLHGDGKSNIISGSCFDNDIIEIIKNKKPTIGFLNPPYKSKTDDVEEFEFILNSLDCLEKHGECVAIVPMSCALAQSGERLRLKEQLLSKHTLNAVFSMPDELFCNSKVGTNTCIMVFKAHTPNPKNKKTFFGYFKDDGFYKKRTKGRYDYDNKWSSIKETWIDLYINNEEKVGVSKSIKVLATDEWCAEQYIQTDYTKLTDNMFQQTALDYLSYYVSRGDFEAIKSFLNNREKKELNIKTWGNFNVGKLFKISLGKPIHKNSIRDCSIKNNSEYIPYVTRTTKNNGIEMYIDRGVLDNEDYIQEKNCLTIGAEGFKAFYQKNSFATGNKVNVLRSKHLNLEISLFVNCVLNFEIEKKFGYGRGLVKFRVMELSIKLPKKDNQPDWQFMEDYIKSLPYSSSL